MKKTAKKLTLSRESLRLLAMDTLASAHGGAGRRADPYTEVFCPSAYTGVCEPGTNGNL
jgi:hypothetical protein